LSRADGGTAAARQLISFVSIPYQCVLLDEQLASFGGETLGSELEAPPQGSTLRSRFRGMKLDILAIP
jgi:hypothetical protein